MSENQVSKLVADLIKDPAEVKTFMEEDEKYLSVRGITIPEKEKTILKSIVKGLTEQDSSLVNADGGHTNINTHTDSNFSDGHVNRNSHTNHTSSY